MDNRVKRDNKNSFGQSYFNWELVEKKNSFITISTVNHILGQCRNIGKPISELEVLDVGCGAGQFTFEIAKKVGSVVGVEPFKEAYLKAISKKRKLKFGKNITFQNIPIEKYDTEQKFDLVLCLTTLEHMPDANTSFNKIYELLKEGGKIYLTVPNKLWPYEYHYRLPFLSWLPIKYANLYVRLTRRGASFEDSAYAMSYLGIKKFFDNFPCRYEFIVPDPREKFLGLGSTDFFYNQMKNMGIWFLKKFSFFWFFSKAFIIVITKKRLSADIKHSKFIINCAKSTEAKIKYLHIKREA